VLRAYALGGEDPSLAGLTGAGKLVDEALRLDPDFVPALVLRAALFHDEGEVDPNADRNRIAREQDRYTARAVQLDPTDPRAWNWRTQALASLGRWNAALESSATEIKLDPFDGSGYLARANLMILTGRPAEALPLVDRALELRPDDPWAAETACEAHLFVGETE
jgi:tetratricopeptide (TPR) repeat protein